MDAIGDLKDATIRDYVYSRLFTAGGTSKQTAAGRFRNLDEFVVSTARKNEQNVVHDIGVSSGVTSLELFLAFRANDLSVRFHVSDKYARYETTGRALVGIEDADGRLVEMYVGRVLAKRDVAKVFFVTRLMYALLARNRGRKPTQAFLLFDPYLMDHINRGLISNLDYDVFETRAPSVFTFVRCMNLLNLDRFAPDKIECGLQHIVESLKENGVLQIGRTMQGGQNKVGFYSKSGEGLVLVREMGGGTELRDLLKKFEANAVLTSRPEAVTRSGPERPGSK